MTIWPTVYKRLRSEEDYDLVESYVLALLKKGERGGSVVECRTPEREVRGSRPTAAVLCP